MPNFLELPAEIASQIAWYLDPDTIRILRQTCRSLNEITWPVFQGQFEQRNVMLQRLSLENLKDISQHPRLKFAVKELRVCTHFIPIVSEDELNRRCKRYHVAEGLGPFVEGVSEGMCESCRVRQRLQEQETSLKLDEYRSHLAQAMESLPNCKSLVLSDAHRPWGAARLEEEIGCELEKDVCPDGLPLLPFWRYVLDTMLVAAAESKVCLERLDIYLGHGDEIDCFAPTIVSVLDESVGRDTMEHVPLQFTHLTKLRIVLSPDFVDETDPDWRLGVIRFFAMFPQLSDLALAFDGEDLWDERNLFPDLSKLLNIPQLRILELAGLETTELELMAMLARHQGTLEEVTLREVKMSESESWPSLLEKVWRMDVVRRVNFVNCLVDYEYLSDIHEHLPFKVSITDEDTLARAITWVEEALKMLAEDYTLES